MAGQMHVVYHSLIHYCVSIPNITMCSFWRLAVARPDLRQMCRRTLSMICAHDAGVIVRCEMCSTFEPSTLGHLVNICPSLLGWRQDLICEIQEVCGVTVNHLLPFVVEGWVHCGLDLAGPIVVKHMSSLHGLMH